MQALLFLIIFLASIQDLFSQKFYNTGLDFYERGRYEEAIFYFKLALDNSEDEICSDYIFYYLGKSYLEMGKYTLAVEYFKKSIPITESPTLKFNNLFYMGYAYFMLKNYAMSAECFKEAISVNPKDETAYYNLGVTFYMLNKYSDALFYLKKFLAFNPCDCELKEKAQNLVKEIEKILEPETKYSYVPKFSHKINSDYDFYPPLDFLYVSSEFGAPRSYGRHQGIDFLAPYNTPVYSIDDGVVIFADWNGGYGKTIEIKHPNNVYSLYAHLNEILVSKGQMVKRGQLIGRVGSTGSATGPHLHFELKINGISVDPKKFLKP